MLEYLAAHMGYIVVTMLLVLIVTAVIVRMIRDKKTGSGGCWCGCRGCANAPYCHPQKDAQASKST